jgi:hypothetical protein
MRKKEQKKEEFNIISLIYPLIKTTAITGVYAYLIS